MQIRVLGHLEASVDDRPVALGGAKQRAVLAMLGLEANRAVSADRLIEGLWGEHPPPSAAKMVQNYVWRLRKVLGDDVGVEIVTRGRAYELQIDDELVDARRLERLVSDASRAAENGEPGTAAREALALFRGEPLADVADEPFAIAEIRRLEELRLTAAELAIDADLAAGRHQEVAGEIEALLGDNHLRERLHAQRMLALYRCGRQAEALEAYRHARRTLVEEIGVEPSPALRRLHDEILRQDPALDVVARPPELPPELDPAAAPPLLGRDGELRRLRALRQRAAEGAGALVAVAGAYGMGKTRIAAEIAGEAHREGAAVLYAAGTGAPESVLVAIGRAHEQRRPALVVVDDADRTPTDVRAALRALAQVVREIPVLVLVTGQEEAALARLEPDELLVLGPLDAGSVRAIAALYAPAGADAVAADALLASGHGVPRRVHEAAAEWARREATRRVDAAAGRAAAGRSEASALVAALAGDVVELQSARERAGRVAGEREAAETAVCPYKGLAPFESADADYFFGRERLVAELVARLVGVPLLAVVGPSGSGKSSVLRAGLLPALAGGVLPGSENWIQAVIRPGTQPLRDLRRVTAKLARERRGVLAVDQFEELFTACPDEEERREFVETLARAAGDRIVVLLAVRADFYGRCAAYPRLSRLLGANHVLVGPMSREELRRAIERPAQRAGLGVEPELVEALVTDVEGQPGALPLLSTALHELWRRRDGRHLRLAAYARSGGVQGAVARLAEEAFLGLEPAQQDVARKLLLRLADEDESGAIVRRRIALPELDADRRPEVTEVVDRLADRRLLTVSDGAVEVAHEALLREWPRLRGWLDEDVQGRRLHRRLGAAARAWDGDARAPDGLYRGASLAAALDWAAGHDPELNAIERAFLEDSRRASGRAQRRLRLVLAGVGCLLVLAVIAGAVALEQRGNARAKALAADAQRLGAQALVDEDIDRALLLARQGVALDDSLQTRGNLFAALLRSPAVIAVLRGDGDRQGSLALSPDGRTVAFIDQDGTLRRVDTRTRQPTVPARTVPGIGIPEPVGLDALAYDRAGARLAVGGSQPVVLDADSYRVVAQLPLLENQVAYRLRFSGDGRSVFVVLLDGVRDAITLRAYDADSGRRLATDRPLTRGFKPVALMATRDGRRVVTSFDGGPTEIFDARTLRPLARLRAGSAHAALSPDDRTLLLGMGDGSVRFLDLVTGTVRTASGRHQGAVVAAAFSGDGRTAVTGGEDDRLIVWDARRAAAGETLQGHAGEVAGLAITRDGRTLYTAGSDGKVLFWDLARERRLGRPFSTSPGGRLIVPDAPLVSEALSPDGRVLAAGAPDGTVGLTDARTLRPISRFRAVPDGPVRGMAFVPGTRRLVVGGENGFLGVFDAERGALVRRLRGYVTVVLTPSFSADGRLMATVGGGGGVLLWPMRDGLPVGQPRTVHSGVGPGAAALSPDGRTLAITAGLGIEIVDVATLRRRTTLPEGECVFELGFTPDGRDVIGGSVKGWTRLWSVDTARPATAMLGGQAREVIGATVSPDGRTLATGTADGTIRLFDLQSERPIGAPLTGPPVGPVVPEFTPDGAFLFAISATGRAYRWDIRPSSWARHACAVAGRALTRAEWAEALPGREYTPACAG